MIEGQFIYLNKEHYQIQNGQFFFQFQIDSQQSEEVYGKYFKQTNSTQQTFQSLTEKIQRLKISPICVNSHKNVKSDERNLQNNKFTQNHQGQVVIQDFDENDQIINQEEINLKQQKQDSQQSANSEESIILEQKQNETKIQKQVNETKNITKGMTKALSHWILDKRNQQFLQKFAFKHNFNLQQYQNQFAREIRKAPSVSIAYIKSKFVSSQDNKWASITRILCNYFLRKRFISHIFNSKMQKIPIHLKYISRWKEVLRNPSQFKSLK